MTENADTSGTDGPWEECPSGALDKMVQEIQADRTRRFVRSISGAVLSVALFCGVAYVASSNNGSTGDRGPSTRMYGGLSCPDVLNSFVQYSMGTLGVETRGKVDAHLNECEHCRDLFQKKMESKSGRGPSTPADAGSFASATFFKSMASVN